jgi:hypothetical protein
MVQSLIGEISIWEQSGREIFTGSITDNVLIGTKQNTGGEKLFVVGNTKIEGDVEITGTITATVNANTINISDNNVNDDFYLVFTDDSGSNRTLQIDKSSSPLTYNPVNNRLTVSGNVFANFWGDLTGTASVATTLTTTSTSSNVGYYILFGGNHLTGANTVYANANLNYNPSTNTLTGGIFNGTSFSGNAGTATQLQSGRNINGVYFDGTANIQTIIGGTNINITTSSTINLDTVLTGLTSITSTDFIGNLTGNAGSATQLQSGRNINGVFFDGTANIQTIIGGTNINITTNSTINLDTVLTGLTSITSTDFIGDLTGNVVGNVVGNLTGTSSVATTLTMTNTSTNVGFYLVFSSSPSTGNNNAFVSNNLNYNPSTDILSVGNIITADITGTSLDLSSTLEVDGKGKFTNDVVVEGKVGINMAVSTTPLVPLHIIGTSADPTSNGLDGIVQIATNTLQTDNKLCLGVVNGSHSWLQAYKKNVAFEYGNISLNPAGGNVSVGVDLSLWKFRVSGDTHFGDSGQLDNTKYGLVQITRAGNQGTKYHLSFIRNGHTVSGIGYLSNSNVFGIQNQYGDNTSTSGIFINYNKIGINQTNPPQALTINGIAEIRNTGSGSRLRLVNHLSGGYWDFFPNHSSSYNNLHIQYPIAGGGVYMSPGDTFWRAISDDRYKHNEVEITNGLNVIMKMKPQIYDRSSKMLDEDFNGNLDDLNIKYFKESGFIAQEVYQIPELKHIVDKGDDDMPWSLIYPQIIPYNTSAIQQLNNKVIKLEEENTSQNQYIDMLEAKISELENNLELIMEHLNLI